MGSSRLDPWKEGIGVPTLLGRWMGAWTPVILVVLGALGPEELLELGFLNTFIGDPWKCLRVLLGSQVSAFWADVGDQDVLEWSGARSPSSCLQHRTTRSLSKISGTGIVDPGLRKVWDKHEGRGFLRRLCFSATPHLLVVGWGQGVRNRGSSPASSVPLSEPQHVINWGVRPA